MQNRIRLPPFAVLDYAHGVRVEVQAVAEDNYQFLILAGHDAVAVDPAEASSVRAAVAKWGATLAGILITHHHADHVAGVPELVAEFRCPVIGPNDPALSFVTRCVGEGDVVEIAGLRIMVLATPGHTASHVSYFLPAPSLAFVGDVMFTMGCGRVAPGLDPAMLYRSIQRVCALGEQIQIYSGHEYAAENARFALTVEPDNGDLRERAKRIAAMRRRGEPTVPTTIAEERATNVFVRARDPRAFAELRAQKNNFA